MKLHDIREMIKLVNQTSIEELVWETDGTSITIKKAAPITARPEALPVSEQEVAEATRSYEEAAATAETANEEESPAAAAASAWTIRSTSVGTFTAAVAVGDAIAQGALVGRCSVEALQLYDEIVSPVDGTVTEILVTDGELVDYGKPLIVVEPNQEGRQ